MSGREAMLGRIRRALSASPGAAGRGEAVADRLARHPAGVVPARGRLDAAARISLFCDMAQKVSATVTRVGSAEEVPAAVTGHLRSRNLAASVRMGTDRRLADMPWSKERTLEIRHGAADAEDAVGVSHAVAAIAESGTLVLTSGSDNPTTINFLPEHHIVVVDAADIAGDMETVLAALRKGEARRGMPRTVNFVTGPSRSGDIEQKLLLGAHGPRALHVIVVG